MKRQIVMFILGFIAALAITALSGGAQADHAPGCPDTVGNGRRLIREETMARWSKCVYGPPTGDICGTNALGWESDVLRRNGRRVVCLYLEPVIPDINGGSGQ